MNSAGGLYQMAKRLVRPLAGRLRSRDPMRPIRAMRKWVAGRYLRGNGIEIGALHEPLVVPRLARVRYIDRLPVPELRKHYPELGSSKLVPVDIIDDGESLATIPGRSQDFVIANHFLEHCQDPITAVNTMLRVLKPGGILYLAVPDKRFTYDSDRPVTPLAHVIRDHEEGGQCSRRQHLEEWVRFVDKLEGEPAERKLHWLMETDYSIHFHVWTQTEVVELLLALHKDFDLPFEIEAFCRNRHENIFVLRKQ